ncbi:rhomboid family intramembrane serine protease [Peribacillus sp. SCS-37]|uniref:rhomboid family intramembrane serine protease n=1 Tax=Paraperibacillus esterisolvens TaxID=3115296 RepID=UPI003905F61F
MGNREDFLFWAVAAHLVRKRHMGVIYQGSDGREIWLHNTDPGLPHQVIRLALTDFAWTNLLKRDIEQTAVFGENNRPAFRARNLSILNVYFMPAPPVDDFHSAFEDPAEFKGTKVTSIIADTGSGNPGLQKLEAVLQTELPFSMVHAAAAEESEINELKSAALKERDRPAASGQELFEAGKPFFTYVFLFLQIAVFVLLELNGGSQNSQTLIDFGAKYNPLILEGEWWRFFAPIVLHIGLLHLLTNSLSLYYMGTLVERIFGRIRFLFMYIFAGFSGTLASFLTNDSLSAGASGAIFGCFGALLFFGILNPRIFFRTMGTNIIVLLVINLGIGFTVPVVDNAGHIGGLIGGFIAAAIVSMPGRKKPLFQGVSFLIAAFLIFFLIQQGYASGSAGSSEETAVSIAQQHIKDGKKDEAYQVLKKFTNRNSAAPKSYFLMAYIEAERNETDQAEAHLKKAVGQDKEFDEAYFNLALVYVKKQQMDDAYKMAGKALDIDPGNEQYQKFYKQLEEYR